MGKLIWNPVKEYWYCSICGAIYRKPKNWKPPCDFCMRCNSEWDNTNEG